MFKRMLAVQGGRFYSGASKKYGHWLYRVLEHQHDFRNPVPTVLEKGKHVMSVTPVESLEGGVFVQQNNISNCFDLSMQEKRDLSGLTFYEVTDNAVGLRGIKHYGKDTSLPTFFIDQDKLKKTGSLGVCSHKQLSFEELPNKATKK